MDSGISHSIYIFSHRHFGKRRKRKQKKKTTTRQFLPFLLVLLGFLKTVATPLDTLGEGAAGYFLCRLPNCPMATAVCAPHAPAPHAELMKGAIYFPLLVPPCGPFPQQFVTGTLTCAYNHMLVTLQFSQPQDSREGGGEDFSPSWWCDEREPILTLFYLDSCPALCVWPAVWDRSCRPVSPIQDAAPCSILSPTLDLPAWAVEGKTLLPPIPVHTGLNLSFLSPHSHFLSWDGRALCLLEIKLWIFAAGFIRVFFWHRQSCAVTKRNLLLLGTSSVFFLISFC